MDSLHIECFDNGADNVILTVIKEKIQHLALNVGIG